MNTILWYLFLGIVLIPLFWIKSRYSTKEKANIVAIMSERCYMTAQEIRYTFKETYGRDLEIRVVELCLRELIYSEVVEQKVLLPFSDLTPGYKLKNKDGVSNTPASIPTQGCYA